LDLKILQPNGKSIKAASDQRILLSMIGDIAPTANLPTMALPAHKIVGKTM
jgi:hypothetical protein